MSVVTTTETSSAQSTQFCECGDLMYVHDSSVFEAAANTTASGRAMRQKSAAASAPNAAAAAAPSGGAHWYCKRCGFTKPLIGPTVVHETRKPGGAGDRGGAALAQINKYTTMDPTLPREYVCCPNPRCESHPGGGRAAAAADVAEVVVVRTHYQRQEYAFVCSVCQHKWMAK